MKEYWLVDPDQKQIEVLVLKGERYKSLGVYGIAQFLESAILKGLKVDVGKAFLKNSSKSY